MWLGITNTIYSIHSLKEPVKMADTVLKEIRWLIPFDHAMFFVNTNIDEDAVGIPSVINFSDEFVDLFVKNHTKYDCTVGLKAGGNSIVYRESDVVDPKLWRQSKFFLEFCQPNEIKYILQVVLCYNNIYCGNLLLFRDHNSINAIDFSDKDMFIMNLLTGHLELGIARLQSGRDIQDLYQSAENIEKLENNKDNEKLTVDECVLQFHLTKREEQILRLILEGYQTNDICNELFITLNTLKKHIFNMYRKLGINSRTQLFKRVKEKKGL